jgi:uncharacterized membrane protein
MKTKPVMQFSSRQTFISHPWIYWVLGIALALGIFFRLVNLGEKVYWNDEAITSLRISGYTETEVRETIYDRSPIEVVEILRYQHPNPKTGLEGVIHSVATEDAHLSILYNLIARVWIDWFGSSPATVRSLSAFFGLLALPCLYWLCQELFQSPLTGAIAVSLMAVSPFHVLYSQEARQYSLWTFSILLSCAVLLRALKVQTRNSWLFYGLTVALGIYSHTLFLFVAIAHGIYVFCIARFRFNPQVFNYLFSTLGGSLLFLPWALVAIAQIAKIQSNVARTNINVGWLALFKSWLQSFNRIFVDIPHFSSYFLPIVLALSASAIYFLFKKTSQKTYLLVFLLIFNALPLMLPDLILGGKRSSDGRYLIPSYLGLEIALAYLLSRGIDTARKTKQKFWQAILLIFLLMGTFSCMLSFSAKSWWNKSSGHYNPQIAEIINKTNNPLVISDNSPGRILSLSHLLTPNVKLLLLSQVELDKIPKNVKNIFVFQPSTNAIEKLSKDRQYNLKKLFKDWLWKLENKPKI